MGFLLVMFLLLLALDLAVLRLILLLLLGSLDLVLLVLGFESLLGGGLDIRPHITNDLGDLSYFGGRVVGLHAIIDFSPVKEKSGQCALGGRWLYRHSDYFL
jgi:hypothetical protein